MLKIYQLLKNFLYLKYCILSLINCKLIATENIRQKFYSFERKGKLNWILNFYPFLVHCPHSWKPADSLPPPAPPWSSPTLAMSTNTTPPTQQCRATTWLDRCTRLTVTWVNLRSCFWPRLEGCRSWQFSDNSVLKLLQICWCWVRVELCGATSVFGPT